MPTTQNPDPISDVQLNGLRMLATQEWRKRSAQEVVKNPVSDDYKIAITIWRTLELETKESLERVGIHDQEFADAEPLDHVEKFGSLKYLEAAVQLLDAEYKAKLKGVAVGRLFETLIAEVALRAVRKSLEEASSE